MNFDLFRLDWAAWRLALALARREMRAGLRGFRTMLACLALGVGAIAGVGSLSASVDAALTGDARALLGGDVELDLIHRPANAAEHAAMAAGGRISETDNLRAMARGTEDKSKPQLVELKAVDGNYPLFGQLALEPPQPGPVQDNRSLFAERDGVWGAAADPELFARLGLKRGDEIRIGSARYQLRAAIAREPDRGSEVFILGPRVLVAQASLAATALVQPGSLIHYHYRLALARGANAQAWLDDIDRRFPDAGWRSRTYANAAPRLAQFLHRIALFLTLVGLTALLVGGVGVANAIKAYLDARVTTIAILKCLGATQRLVFRLYLAQTLAMAGLGIALGVGLGAALPFALGGTLSRYLPVVARIGIYPEPLLLAAAYGLLTVLVFTLWPLAEAGKISPAQLFRGVITPERVWPRLGQVLTLLPFAAALAALTVFAAVDRSLAFWFVLGAIATLVAFRAAGYAIEALAGALARQRMIGRGRPALRLALANLSRPGAPTASVVLSLGVGLTLLVAVGLVQGNLDREVGERMPEGAPAFYFVDIQPDELAAFDRAVLSVPGASGLEQVPSLRGRITRLGGQPVEEAIRQGRGSWALDGDRGLTYAATPPAGSRIVAGQWWPADYHGAPLVSLDAAVAKQLHLGLGDTLTVNVLGREVTARVASLREIDWTSLGINFVMLFSPGILEHAPQTYIATIRATDAAEEPVLRAVVDRFPNVTAIRVKEALAEVETLLGQVGSAVRLTAAFTLLAGMLVLASAIAAEHSRRVYDAVVLKVLGAGRRRLFATFLIEYGLLGLAASLLATLFGAVAGWLLVTRVMEGEWVFLPGGVAAIVAVAVALTLLFGFAGTWRALGQKPARLLRNE